jgi:hypothetical protein
VDEQRGDRHSNEREMVEAHSVTSVTWPADVRNGSGRDIRA